MWTDEVRKWERENQTNIDISITVSDHQVYFNIELKIATINWNCIDNKLCNDLHTVFDMFNTFGFGTSRQWLSDIVSERGTASFLDLFFFSSACQIHNSQDFCCWLTVFCVLMCVFFCHCCIYVCRSKYGFDLNVFSIMAIHFFLKKENNRQLNRPAPIYLALFLIDLKTDTTFIVQILVWLLSSIWCMYES